MNRETLDWLKPRRRSVNDVRVCPTCGLHPYDFDVDEYKRELERVSDALLAAAREAADLQAENEAFAEVAREIEARRRKWSQPGQLPFPIATSLDKLAALAVARGQAE